MTARNAGKNDLEYANYTNDSNTEHSVRKVSDTPTTDYDGWVHARKFFNNAGAIDIAVDGSITTQEFSLTLAANEVFLVHQLEIVLTDKGNINNLDGFMSLAGLTNGLEIEAQLATPQDVVNIKTNYGLINRLRRRIELKDVGTDSVAVGEAEFIVPINLDGSQGHTIIARVQDNLSSLQLSTVSATGVVKEF